jgi:hypothetical protein
MSIYRREKSTAPLHHKISPLSWLSPAWLR